MKSKKPISIRDQVFAAVLSESVRAAIKLIGYVAAALLTQHFAGAPVAPEFILV